MGGRNEMNNIIESTKLYNMKFFYLQTLCVLAGIVFFQDSSGQNLVPFANNTFNLGNATRNWKTLYVNNIDASGNITTGGTLSVTGITSLGGLQIKGPTSFTGFGAGVLTTNTSGVLSSGPLTAAQIPLLPYLLLTGGTLTGTLNGQAANFTGAVTGLTSLPSDNSNNLATTAFVQSAISSVASSSGAWKLTGNSGTVDGTNFIGTTDNVPLSFRINNLPAGRIDMNSNAFFGYRAGGTNGNSNTAIGSLALADNNEGFYNSAIGVASLLNNTSGFRKCWRRSRCACEQQVWVFPHSNWFRS